MTVTLTLPAEIEDAIQDAARRQGQTPEEAISAALHSQFMPHAPSRAAFLTPDGEAFEVANVPQEALGRAAAAASEAVLKRLWKADEEDTACRLFSEAT